MAATIDPTKIVQARNVKMWLTKAAGATFPADLSDPTGTGFWFAGATDEESLKFPHKPTWQEVTAHQSDYPVKMIQTKSEGSVQITLKEWSAQNFQAVYGGGTFTEIAGPPALHRFAPPAFNVGLELGCLFDVLSGTYTYRFIVPRCQNLDGVELELPKTKESLLPLSLAILGTDGTDPWYLLTDDPAFTAPA